MTVAVEGGPGLAAWIGTQTNMRICHVPDLALKTTSGFGRRACDGKTTASDSDK